MEIMNGSYTIDYKRHNEEVRELWAAYNAGDPPRTPIIFGINPRLILQDPTLNKKKTTFRDYILDPDVMFDTQLQYRFYVRHNIPQDQEMGLPEAWPVYVDFQNIYEGAWLGCFFRFYNH